MIGPDHKFIFEKEDVWSILLRSDYTAEGSFCPMGDLSKCDNSKTLGSWSTMDENELIVYLNDLRFHATFRYNLLKNVTKGKPPYEDGIKFEKLH